MKVEIGSQFERTRISLALKIIAGDVFPKVLKSPGFKSDCIFCRGVVDGEMFEYGIIENEDSQGQVVERYYSHSHCFKWARMGEFDCNDEPILPINFGFTIPIKDMALIEDIKYGKYKVSKFSTDGEKVMGGICGLCNTPVFDEWAHLSNEARKGQVSTFDNRIAHAQCYKWARDGEFDRFAEVD